jgi:hypothetical protein
MTLILRKMIVPGHSETEPLYMISKLRGEGGVAKYGSKYIDFLTMDEATFYNLYDLFRNHKDIETDYSLLEECKRLREFIKKNE